MSEQQANDAPANDAGTNALDVSLKIVHIALELLPEVIRMIEERKQRTGLSDQEILAQAGIKFSDNTLILLADLARLEHPTQS
ncbi:MAG: hypothetical protein ACRD9R_10840 [Pyrinomonadaceae bacterium]